MGWRCSTSTMRRSAFTGARSSRPTTCTSRGRPAPCWRRPGEFGRRHAQEMILIARNLREGEHAPAARLGLTILLNAPTSLGEAVEITALVQVHGFQGATFAAKRQGAVAIYHTDSLGMTA